MRFWGLALSWEMNAGDAVIPFTAEAQRRREMLDAEE
jgi:hypothetical protein